MDNTDTLDNTLRRYLKTVFGEDFFLKVESRQGGYSYRVNVKLPGKKVLSFSTGTKEATDRLKRYLGSYLKDDKPIEVSD